jgi:hypothetical protein
MSLDRKRLENVRELANGGLQARCPACAEKGNDGKGEHLRISPEGKFGCCVFPGDREHRQRIFALAGSKSLLPSRQEIRVRVKVATAADVGKRILTAAPTAASVISGGKPNLSGKPKLDGEPNIGSDASDGVLAVQTEFQEIRTARTPDLESEKTVSEESRTARTGYVQLTRDEVERDPVSIYKLKEFDRPVRPVRDEVLPPITEPSETVRLPHLLADGTLVIPFNSPQRYHWWKEGGQSPRQTKQELFDRKQNDASPF